jgi:RNA polymerase sigma-70 factor (ECF subfamily)
MPRQEDEFERVAMPHTRSLLRFALRLTHNSFSAEDLVQETLLLAWRGFHQFESGSNARAWLFRILINAFNMQNRKAGPSLPALALTPGFHGPSDSNFESLEVMQAVDRLAPDHRAVLLLAVIEGFTCREIAEILTIPIGTVMSRLSRAREAMRESLSPRSGRQGEKVVR